MTEPAFVYQTDIATTPERLWAALTSGELTRRYRICGPVLRPSGRR